jgi:hypothetical protein
LESLHRSGEKPHEPIVVSKGAALTVARQLFPANQRFPKAPLQARKRLHRADHGAPWAGGRVIRAVTPRPLGLLRAGSALGGAPPAPARVDVMPDRISGKRPSPMRNGSGEAPVALAALAVFRAANTRALPAIRPPDACRAESVDAGVETEQNRLIRHDRVACGLRPRPKRSPIAGGG